MISLSRLLNPATIAVVGGDEAAQVVRQCRKLGFAGEIMAVHPRRKTLAGVRCIANIRDLPTPPDAAFIAIPAAATLAAVAELAQLGAGGAVCYAAGFGETSGGGARNAALIRAAAAMPILGPNCYGYLNLLTGAALWPDHHGGRRAKTGAAIFSQSGNVSLNLTLQQRFLPLAMVVTVGNQAVVGLEHCIAAALGEPRITAIGLQMEGITDLALFAKLAAQARAKRVPIIALKLGRSAAGARAAMSHTATLVGQPRLYDALFSRLGIAAVTTPEEFIETLKLAAAGDIPRGNTVASMSCSGGEAAMVADLCAQYNLPLPPLKPAHRRAVQAALNTAGEVARADNPLDYHTFIWGDRARLTAVYRAMMAGDFAWTLLVLDTPPPAPVSWRVAAQAFIAAARMSGGRAVVVATLSENMPAAMGELLARNGITPLCGLAQGIAAVAAVCSIGRGWKKPPPLPQFPRAGKLNSPAKTTTLATTLDEVAAKKILSRGGFTTPVGMVVRDAKAAVLAAEKIGWPVVVKAVSAEILHKTERGAVAVGLQNAQAVETAAARMLTIAPQVLVEKMVTDAVAEMVLSLGWDAQFGRFVMLGFGGAMVELLGDRAVVLPPFNRAMFAAAAAWLRGYNLLRGYRGRAPADINAVYNCAQKLLALADKNPRIIEIEINPLLVRAKGAVAVDALITTAPN